MTRRSGITLLEVLVAIFIMGIGMIALLTLFPLAALSMAAALRDDRVAHAASNATALANALDLRHDSNLMTIFNQLKTNGFKAGAPASTDFAGYPVLIDPYYAGGGLDSVGDVGGTTPGVPRVALNHTPTERWFVLPDDIGFQPNGMAEGPPSGLVQRGGRYSWTYLVRRPRGGDPSVVELSVLVYVGRAIQLPQKEPAYVVSTDKDNDPYNVTIAWGGSGQNPERPKIKRGSWLMDTTYENKGGGGHVHGYLYRVVNVTGDNPVTVELESPLKANAGVMVLMEELIEVFEKGSGWQP